MWKIGSTNSNHFVQCSLVKSPTIFIENMPRQKIEFLMDEYPHQEWLAYLVGKQSKKENFFVEDIIIPPHEEVSSTSAEAEPFNIPRRCIGIIHSHHSMGAFHSATDKDYVDQNFPVSITAAKRSTTLEYDAVSYQKTLCGKVSSIKGEVKYVQATPMFNKAKFLRRAKANIEKGKKPVCIYTGQGIPPRIVAATYAKYGLNEPAPDEGSYLYRGNVGRQIELGKEGDEEEEDQSQERINQSIKEIQEGGHGFW